MKKTFSALLIFALLLISLCSCNSNSSIKKITVGGESLLSSTVCETIYLYRFEEAEVSGKVWEDNGSTTPQSTGYIYSTEELAVGDKISVWNQFSYNVNYQSYSGVDALVAEVVETYGVKLSSTSSTYSISFYSVENISKTTVKTLEDIAPITKSEVKAPKDKVTLNIIYN